MTERLPFNPTANTPQYGIPIGEYNLTHGTASKSQIPGWTRGYQHKVAQQTGGTPIEQSINLGQPLQNHLKSLAAFPFGMNIHNPPGQREFQVNRKIPYAIMPKRFGEKDSTLNEYIQGQLVFIYHEEGLTEEEMKSFVPSHGSIHARSNGSLIRTNKNVVMSLPKLNSLFCATEEKTPNITEQSTYEDTMGKWSLFGAVTVEDGGDVNDKWTSSPRGQKILNCIIQGGTGVYIFNLWGSKLKQGTKLFLILKRISRKELPKAYGVDARGTSITHKKNTNLVDSPFQLIPWADYQYNYPPKSAREYIDNFGHKRYGKVIRVGIVQVPPSSFQDERVHDGPSAPWNNVVSMVGQQKIFVYIDIHHNIF